MSEVYGMSGEQSDRIEELEARVERKQLDYEGAMQAMGHQKLRAERAESRIEELEAENQDLRDSKADMLANHIHATAELQSRIDAGLRLADDLDAGREVMFMSDVTNRIRETLQSADTETSNQPEESDD